MSSKTLGTSFGAALTWRSEPHKRLPDGRWARRGAEAGDRWPSGPDNADLATDVGQSPLRDQAEVILECDGQERPDASVTSSA